MKDTKRITLGEDQFQQLVDGQVVTAYATESANSSGPGNEVVEIILSDIGLDRIIHAVLLKQLSQNTVM